MELSARGGSRVDSDAAIARDTHSFNRRSVARAEHKAIAGQVVDIEAGVLGGDAPVAHEYALSASVGLQVEFASDVASKPCNYPSGANNIQGVVRRCGPDANAAG